MLTDAHCHIRPDEDVLYTSLLESGRYGVAFSVADPHADPMDVIYGLRSRFPQQVRISAGIHPWRAGRTAWEDMLPLFDEAELIGEIGMDIGWTDTNLEVQRRVFVRQMETAKRMQMGVVLHTHGCEREIADIIRSYELPLIVVHWYSGDSETLRDYVSQGCYFTTGPDCIHNPAVQQVVRSVPMNRLLTETDGVDALRWIGMNPPDQETALQHTLAQIAALKGISVEEAECVTAENFHAIYRKTE